MAVLVASSVCALQPLLGVHSPIERVVQRFAASNAVVAVDGSSLGVVLDAGASLSNVQSANFTIRRGSNPLLSIADSNDGGHGTLLAAGKPSDCQAYFSFMTGDAAAVGSQVERVRIDCNGISVKGGAVINSNLYVNGSGFVDENLIVGGQFSASGYVGLVDDYYTPSPFVPASANALYSAYVALSNMIRQNSGSNNNGGGGNNSNGTSNNNGGGGGSNNGPVEPSGCGSCDDACPLVPLGPYPNGGGWWGTQPLQSVTGCCGDTLDPIETGVIACADLIVGPNGSVNALSFCNLIDDYRTCNVINMPPTANALNSAYLQLSNFVITQIAAAQLLGGGGGSGNTNNGIATSFQGAMWLKSTVDNADRFLFGPGGPTQMRAFPEVGTGYVYKWGLANAPSSCNLMSVDGSGRLTTFGGATFNGADVNVRCNLRVGGSSLVVPSGSFSVACNAFIGGTVIPSAYSNLPLATQYVQGITRVRSDVPLPENSTPQSLAVDSNDAASIAALQGIASNITSDIEAVQGAISDVVLATNLALLAATDASNQANAYQLRRGYNVTGDIAGLIMSNVNTASNSRIVSCLQSPALSDGHGFCVALASAAGGNVGSIYNETQGPVLLQGGPAADTSNPAASLYLSDSIEVRSGRGDVPLPPNMTSNAIIAVDPQTGAILDISTDASSLFDATAEWSQPYQGFSDDPGSTAWISVQGSYDTSTGAPTVTGAVTVVDIPNTNGTTIDVRGEWLEMRIDPPLYVSKFYISATNPNYVPDAIQLLGSSDGGVNFEAIGSPASQGIGQAEALLSGAYYYTTSDASKRSFNVFRLVVTKVSVTPGFLTFADVAQIDEFRLFGNTSGGVNPTLFAVDSNSLTVSRRGFIGIGMRSDPEPSAPLHIDNAKALTGGRTIVLWDKTSNAPDEFNFRGWSVSNAALVHRVDDSTSAHIFTAAHRELLRMRGDGVVEVPVDGRLDVMGVLSHTDGTVIDVSGTTSLPPGAKSNGLFIALSNAYVGVWNSNPVAPFQVSASPAIFDGSARLTTIAGECNVLISGGSNATTGLVMAGAPVTVLTTLGASNDVLIEQSMVLRELELGEGGILATPSQVGGGYIVIGETTTASPTVVGGHSKDHSVRVHSATQRVAIGTRDASPQRWDGSSPALPPDPFALDVGQGVRIREGGISFPCASNLALTTVPGGVDVSGANVVGMNVCISSSWSNADSTMRSLGAGFGGLVGFDPEVGEMLFRVTKTAADASGRLFSDSNYGLTDPRAGDAQLAVLPQAVYVGDNTQLIVGRSVYNLDYGVVPGDQVAHWYKIAGFAGADLATPVYVHLRGVCGSQVRPIAVDLRYGFGGGGTVMQHCRLVNDGTLLFARIYLMRHPTTGDVTFYLRIAAPQGAGDRAAMARFDVEATGTVLGSLNSAAALTAEVPNPLNTEIVVWDCFNEYTELVDHTTGTLSLAGNLACGTVISPVESALPGASMTLTAPFATSFDDPTRVAVWAPDDAASSPVTSAFSWAAYLGSVTSNAVDSGGACVALNGGPGGGAYYTTPLRAPPPEPTYQTTLCGFSPTLPGQSNIVGTSGSNIIFDLYTLGGHTARKYVLGEVQQLGEAFEVISANVVDVNAPPLTSLSNYAYDNRDAVIRARNWDWAEGYTASATDRNYVEMRMDVTTSTSNTAIARLKTDAPLILQCEPSQSSQQTSHSQHPPLSANIMIESGVGNPHSVSSFQIVPSKITLNGALCLSVYGDTASATSPAELEASLSNAAFAPTRDALITCGTSNARWKNIFSANGVVQTSDTSYKNTRPLNYGLSHVEKIRTVVYTWKGDGHDGAQQHQDDEYYGVCADELVDVFPELVYHDASGSTPCQLNYSELVPVMVNAIKELSSQVKELQAFIANSATTTSELP